jgi:hypothetical protein
MPHDHLKDPEVHHGSFRVLPRADGGYVVIDVRRKPGYQTVGGKFPDLKQAAQAAEAWHKEGHG